jgi:hypothetical protein
MRMQVIILKWHILGLIILRRRRIRLATLREGRLLQERKIWRTRRKKRWKRRQMKIHRREGERPLKESQVIITPYLLKSKLRLMKPTRFPLGFRLAADISKILLQRAPLRRRRI